MLTGGIEVLCHNLVSANRRVINTSPSLVSAIMQYFGSTKISNLNSRRVNNAGATSASTSDSAESLLNFAPLGLYKSIFRFCHLSRELNKLEFILFRIVLNYRLFSVMVKIIEILCTFGFQRYDNVS